MSTRDEQLPGRGFFGWLGRQIGYVGRAIRNDPAETRLYRQESVEEKQLPADASVKLRRTTIDEVIVNTNKTNHGIH
jgi:hypothetical protein